MTLMIKRTEFEDIDWTDADITVKVPPTWYPNGLTSTFNYQGPRMSWSDHYNSREAQNAWIRKEKSAFWCTKDGLEYGHSIDSIPHVRLVYGGNKGKSMWYPLYKAAKKWNKIDEEAQLTYRRALSRAKIED